MSEACYDNTQLLEAPDQRMVLRIDTQAYRARGGTIEELPYVPSLPFWAWKGNGPDGAKRQRFVGCPSFQGDGENAKAARKRTDKAKVEQLVEAIDDF